MILELIGHEDRYAIEQLQMALFPKGAEMDTAKAESRLHRSATWLTAVTKITVAGVTTGGICRLRASEETVRLRRRALQQSYYKAALPHLPQAPAWGALAGVRPTKITTRCLLEGYTEREADKLMKDIYFVSPERRQLALDCSRSTVKAASLLAPTDVSLYVGIPFCPTRCAYCSFVSRSVGKRTGDLEPYLEALMKELALTGSLLKESGRQLRSIYIGGGTPTTLSTPQLARLMDSITGSFDMSRCLEFTV